MKLKVDEFTGRHFGKYEVLCRIAVGGMAEIFLGFPHSGPFVGRPVVLKRILVEQREDPAAMSMLVNEAKLTARLNHPNVAQVLDLEVDSDEVLLVIEFIAGVTLEEIVETYTQRGEPLPLGFAIAAIREAALGLRHAHTHRNSAGQLEAIVHRDVTPRNAMVSFAGEVKMLDFGIARAHGSERQTQAGMVRGTTAYMSPEQAVGKDLDPRTDLFSLGIIFHELLVGGRLFYRGNPAQEMAAVYEQEIIAPSLVNRRVPRALDALVMRALERKLEDRYQSASEFLSDLSTAAGTLAWSSDRCGEVVRSRFGVRQTEVEAILGRMPAHLTAHRPPCQFADGPTPIGNSVFVVPTQTQVFATGAPIQGPSWQSSDGTEPTIDALVPPAPPIATSTTEAVPSAEIDLPFDVVEEVEPLAPPVRAERQEGPERSVRGHLVAVAVGAFVLGVLVGALVF